MYWTGQKVFGVIAILLGAGLIAAVAAGVAIPVVVLPLISLAVIGAAIYHWVFIRPAPTGVERPERSPRHDEL